MQTHSSNTTINPNETAPSNLSDWQQEMKKLMQDIQENHPFAKMTQEEILQHLRQTREEVYEELYG
jgi:hypothetical protein